MADPALLAKNLALPFLTDDLAVRLIAESELLADGVWTQALLMHAREHNAIEEDSYHDAVIWLVQHNYQYTSIQAETIMVP